MFQYIVSLLCVVPILAEPDYSYHPAYERQKIVISRVECTDSTFRHKPYYETVFTARMKTFGLWPTYYDCVTNQGYNTTAIYSTNDNFPFDIELVCFVKKSDFGMFSNSLELLVEHHCTKPNTTKLSIFEIPFAHDFEFGKSQVIPRLQLP